MLKPEIDIYLHQCPICSQDPMFVNEPHQQFLSWRTWTHRCPECKSFYDVDMITLLGARATRFAEILELLGHFIATPSEGDAA